MMRSKLTRIKFKPGSKPLPFGDQVLITLPGEMYFFRRVTGFAVIYSEQLAEGFYRINKKLAKQITLSASDIFDTYSL